MFFDNIYTQKLRIKGIFLSMPLMACVPSGGGVGAGA
jgi:hypothetical protein